MTIGSILLGLALLGLVGLFIARPLFRPDPRRKPRLTELQALQVQKEAVLAEIISLDFDHDTGKLPDAEYEGKRSQLMAEATAILKQLDALGGETSLDERVIEPQAVVPKRDVGEDIEKAIAGLRAKPVEVAPVAAEKRPVDGTNGKTNFCPQCGQPTDRADKFCTSCGHKLLKPQHA